MNKETLIDKVSGLCRQRNKFILSDGTLNIEDIKHRILKYDPEITGILLLDDDIRREFSTEINNTCTVLRIDDIVKVMEMSDFLPGSYTHYRNVIGLTDGSGQNLSSSGNVVLDWPYKDCVLVADLAICGDPHPESFLNTIICHDDIDVLKSPKILVNKEEFHDTHPLFNDSMPDDIHKRNLIIRGNNLIAGHSILRVYRGRSKLVYLDPPYNTGGSANTFTYNNTFNHSSWLTFMKDRLLLTKELLRDDGYCALTIDHCELFYIGVLMDEIFGAENRLGIVTIVIKPEGRTQAGFFSPTNEFMIVYAKDKSKASFNKVIVDPEEMEKFDHRDDRGIFKLNKFIDYNPLALSNRHDNPDAWYPIYVSPDLSDFSLEPVDGYNEVYPVTPKGEEKSWQTKKGLTQDRIKAGDFYCERSKKGQLEIFRKIRPEIQGQRFLTHWDGPRHNANARGTRRLNSILGKNFIENYGVVSYPKSVDSVRDIVEMTTLGDDLVIDLFAGSGTMGQAVHEANRGDGSSRKFILIEQLDNHVRVCKEVMRKLGIPFIYVELLKWNKKYMNKIAAAKTSQELRDILKEIRDKGYLKYSVDTSKIDKEGFVDLPLEDQKKLLIDCLDMNYAYVGYSEMNDETYSVSQSDKDFNNEFYK